MGILNIINQVASTSSRKEKEAILTAHKDNELLKAVFKATYDTTISYYIKKIPNYGIGNDTGSISLGSALMELNVLSGRILTGNDAVSHLENMLRKCILEDSEIVERIIQRDLKCGATASTANKIWKGLIPEFPYMRCSLPKDAKFNKWGWKKGVYSQLKADSMFCNVDIVSDTIVSLSSRNGTDIPLEQFSTMITELLSKFPSNKRLSGELQVARNGKILPREIANGILNSVAKGGSFEEDDEPVYVAWDILPLDQAIPSGRIKIAYSERFNELKSILEKSEQKLVQLIPTRIVYSLEEAYEHYFELIALDLEGTVIKDPDGDWFDGTSKEQIKLKVRFQVELEIVDFNPGEGKNAATWGSMLCKSSDDLLRVNVNGRSDEMRLDFHNRRDSLIGQIITVESGVILPIGSRKDGRRSLFLPTFIELRDDKTEADSLPRIIEQFEAVTKPK